MIKRVKFILKSLFLVLFMINTFGMSNTFAVLKKSGMKKIEGNWVNLYYEKEKKAAEDVFKLADEKTEAIARKLGFSEKQNVNVYVYDSQADMQSKVRGLQNMTEKLPWYIGDNLGTNVVLTSPAHPGSAHDYESVKNAVLHEIVHAYVSVLNPKISLWLNEGMALHLSNGAPFCRAFLKFVEIPRYEEICTNDHIIFSEIDGYTLAHTYVEYLEKTYGWEKVLELVKTEDYNKVFGKSHREIYDEWASFLRNYPR